MSQEDAAEMREALARLDRECGTDHLYLGKARLVANLPTYDPVFFKTIDHPKVLPLIEHFMGKQLILASLNARIARPSDPVQRLHADIPQSLIKKRLSSQW